MSPTAWAVLNLLVSLFGGASGAFVGLRVAIARIEERNKAQDEKLSDHGERLKRLESVYFSRYGSH